MKLGARKQFGDAKKNALAAAAQLEQVKPPGRKY
jgi:hypothetical protein